VLLEKSVFLAAHRQQGVSHDVVLSHELPVIRKRRNKELVNALMQGMRYLLQYADRPHKE
jgi:hypothetical protein